MRAQGVVVVHPLADLQARILGFPSVKRGLADAVLAHDVCHGLPVLLLLKDSDDLCFAESALFHEEGLKVRKLRLSLLSTGLLYGEAYTYNLGFNKQKARCNLQRAFCLL